MITLNIYVLGFVCLFLLIVGGLLGYFIAKPKKANENDIKIQQEIHSFSPGESRSVELYQNEWQAILETQRHFNDLIIRFRGFTLTGAAVATFFTYLAGK